MSLILKVTFEKKKKKKNLSFACVKFPMLFSHISQVVCCLPIFIHKVVCSNEVEALFNHHPLGRTPTILHLQARRCYLFTTFTIYNYLNFPLFRLVFILPPSLCNLSPLHLATSHPSCQIHISITSIIIIIITQIIILIMDIGWI